MSFLITQYTHNKETNYLLVHRKAFPIDSPLGGKMKIEYNHLWHKFGTASSCGIGVVRIQKTDI